MLMFFHLPIQLLNQYNKILENLLENGKCILLKHLKPKFHPKKWSIDHEMIRTFGENSNFKNDNDLLKYETKKDLLDSK